MAKYQIAGKPPGAQINGVGFKSNGEVVDLPASYVPGRNWIPLDEEAAECKKKLKAALEERITAPKKAIDPLADIVTEIPSDEPAPAVAPEDDGLPLSALAGKPDPRIEAGPVEKTDDPKKPAAPGVVKRGERAADKPV